MWIPWINLRVALVSSAGGRNLKEGMNKRQLGAEKEHLAAEYLAKQGVTVLERNFRCRQGEIDLIGKQGEYLIFIEVKYRRDAEKGLALEAVGVAKQRKICRVADYYRTMHGLGDSICVRYDVVAIQGEEVVWIPNAFPHHYAGR